MTIPHDTSPASEAAWRHLRCDRDADGIAWLAFDTAADDAPADTPTDAPADPADGPGRRGGVNRLSPAVLDEFAQALEQLERQPPGGLVITSAKPAGFIAGADITTFEHLESPEQALALVTRGASLFRRLAQLPFPTLALIHGHCLGGGLELALACRWRVAIDRPDTVFALPEVRLGLLPGWGGMQRLPRLIGAPAALDLMLTGRTVNARRAASLGLVDALVPERVARSAALGMLRNRPARRRARGLGAWLNHPWLKALPANKARKQLKDRDPEGHYPAPATILDIWQHHDGDALRAAEPVAALTSHPTTANLLRVFRLQERLKRHGRQDGVAPARRVHVVGAGVMGGDIAAWCALQGLAVTLQDQDPDRIAAAQGRAWALFERRHPRGAEAQACADRLLADPEGHGLARADVVIEAIVEDLEAKRALYAEIESRMPAGALLATNTSSLPLSALAEGLADPERLVALHFFNPVAQMPLVEVAAHAGDGPRLRRALAFAGQLGKLPLPVADSPGFLVNAALAPYLLAAIRALDQGLAPETIDAALTRHGMAMGPIELADVVGLDVLHHAGLELAGAAGMPACLAARLDHGQLGRKSGQGFYPWKGGKPVKGRAGKPPADLAARLLAPLADSAQACVQAGVVADDDLADAGLIFGAGYAPHTGGPLHARKAQDAQAAQAGHPPPVRQTAD